MTPARVAAVIGATSGIGRATAVRFAAQGMSVIACGRRRERLLELTSEASKVLPFVGDARAPGLVEALFAFSHAELLRAPDVVVLCAGRGLPGSVLGSDESKWRELLEVNYLGSLYQLRACAKLLLAEAVAPEVARDIVVVGSSVGRQVSAANPVYGSTKFALHSLVEALRQEVCAHRIRVTLVEPGFVRSEFQSTAGYDMNWFAALERESGPFLAPDDVARIIELIVAQPPDVHVDDVRIRPTRQRV